MVNQSDAPRAVSLEVKILGPDGKAVRTARPRRKPWPPEHRRSSTQDIAVPSPNSGTWTTPSSTTPWPGARQAATTLDDEVVPFGIREFHFDAATGFWLNGRNFKLKGVCLHHDGGAVGAAVPLASGSAGCERSRNSASTPSARRTTRRRRSFWTCATAWACW